MRYSAFQIFKFHSRLRTSWERENVYFPPSNFVSRQRHVIYILIFPIFISHYHSLHAFTTSIFIEINRWQSNICVELRLTRLLHSATISLSSRRQNKSSWVIYLRILCKIVLRSICDVQRVMLLENLQNRTVFCPFSRSFFFPFSHCLTLIVALFWRRTVCSIRFYWTNRKIFWNMSKRIFKLCFFFVFRSAFWENRSKNAWILKICTMQKVLILIFWQFIVLLLCRRWPHFSVQEFIFCEN